MTETEPRYTVNDEHWRAQGVTMRRVLRLIDIIDCLKERPRTTEELAERYEVHQRTIQRDLEMIQGHPKYAPLVRVQAWGMMPKDDP